MNLNICITYFMSILIILIYIYYLDAYASLDTWKAAQLSTITLYELLNLRHIRIIADHFIGIYLHILKL